jgi:hypothetical protein
MQGRTLQRSLPVLPEREEVETGGDHDQPCDDGAGTAVIFKAKGCAVRTAGAPENGDYANGNACQTQKRKEGEKRAHVGLG